MTLKRLMIVLGVLVFLAGVGIMWLWQYAYSPEGRARVIIAQLKNDTTSLRGWMLQHHVVRPGFSEPPPENPYPHERVWAAKNKMVKLGDEVLPVVIEALRDENKAVRLMALELSEQRTDPAAIPQIIEMCEDSDSWVRSEAVEGLGELKDTRAIPALRKRLNDPSGEVRWLAAESLKKLGVKVPPVSQPAFSM